MELGLGLGTGSFGQNSQGPLLWRTGGMYVAGDAGLQQCSWGEADSDDTAQGVHWNHSLPKQTSLYGTGKVNGHG